MKTKINHTMLSLQESTFKRLLLVCLLMPLASGLTRDCCKPEIDWINDSTLCNDNSRVNLNCTESYVVDPNDEAEGFYSIDEFNMLVAVNPDNTTTIAYVPDEYCQAKLNNEIRYLICFPQESSQPEGVEKWLTPVFGVCSILSGIFLVFTLLVYLILPELRDLQDKAVMCLCASFMVAFFVSGIPKLGNLTDLMNDTTCIVSAFIMYVSFLSAFFWLNVISVNIWRSVWFPRFELSNHAIFALYCAIGWGVPLCFLGVTIIAEYSGGIQIKPAFGEVSCWFKGYTATWLYFYGPICILLVLNLLYLAMTSWKLWHKYETFDCCQAKALETKCAMCLKLSILMGASWIFEVISFALRGTNHLIWLLPDLLNASQGLIIFIFFVVSRAKVRKLLAERRPCKIPFPKSWSVYKDNEKSGNDFIDEFRLSHAS